MLALTWSRHLLVSSYARSCMMARSSISGKSLETLTFDNSALQKLPIDISRENVPREVKGACFSRVHPTPVANPFTVAVSRGALSLLDLPMSESERDEFCTYFSGNKILPGSEPAAHCYCGHQFGYFSGQLGDGAAIYLGEVVNFKSERHEIQIKGAGKTPYSRTADGRKVLRSSIREFLCSEAMHYLGIPTTRAGCVITSDTRVVRDIHYDGNQIRERASQILRISPTFIRFGSFEVVLPQSKETGRSGPSTGSVSLLTTLLEYTIRSFYPEIHRQFDGKSEEMYLEFYKEVIRKTARMVAEWQCVGWCHGVLNTDNMSIVGVTIDYGPYGFMDHYDSNFICNSSDTGGRYAYKKQPEMCRWNCGKLAEALALVLPVEKTKPCLTIFDEVYKEHYETKMRSKMGLLKKLDGDGELFESFLETMEQTGADFTNSFRALSQFIPPSCEEHEKSVEETTDTLLDNCCSLEKLRKYINPQMDPRQLQAMVQMIEAHPELAQFLHKQFEGVQLELAKLEKLEKLKDMTEESKKKEDRKSWGKWIEIYSQRLGKEEWTDEAVSKRQALMNGSNPRFVLRNYIAEGAIKLAEEGDYSEVNRVLHRLQNPYDNDTEAVEGEGDTDLKPPPSSTADVISAGGLQYDQPPPLSSLLLQVS